jgi:hypothetical protein
LILLGQNAPQFDGRSSQIGNQPGLNSNRNSGSVHRLYPQQMARSHKRKGWMAMGQAIALDANPAQADWISFARPQEPSNVGSTLMRIVAATHTSPLHIVSDFARLWYGPGKVSFRDYNRLKLFDQEFWADDDRRNVVGQHRSFEIWTKVNWRHDWWGFFDNKLASSNYLAAFGFPIITNLAIYCENVTIARSAQVLTNKQALRRFLERADHYPLFGKPANGTQSLGSLALRRYRPDDDSVEIFDGQLIRLDDLTAELGKHYTEGYLLQQLIAPHNAIRAICGDRLATIRVLTLRTGSETPQVLRACWKIPVGGNVADNYWRTGNLLAKLDKNTGEVKRAISGSGVDLAAHSHHPDTGASLIGFRLPHWDAVVAMVIEAARVMEQAPLIGWDIAILDDGPLIVEMNGRPDFTLPQLADSRGILTETPLQDFIAVQKNKEAEWRAARQRERKTW